MEKDKQSKLRNKFLKAAAAITVTFQNGPFSPGRDHKFRSDNNTNRWGAKTHAAKGFSGPVVTMIPYEARRKPKDGTTTETQEPTSPKISCMGQIKHHKKKHIVKNNIPLPRQTDASTPKDAEVKKSKFQRIFSHRSRSKSKFMERKSDGNSGFVSEGKNAPPMGDMRRFASSREAFSNFDWKAVIEPEEIDQRDCFTDGEDDEILIPFSAPILVGGGDTTTSSSNLKFKPRNEINLWKRRTMAPPRPLQLNPVLKAK
ncbi:unnamed protein product [Trifolium pratense]|uniref:Uncharacterized protein n=1 Tax=Trifolium pratense TaxID=57577 RepID=A0ACB0M2N7_TRIPR|nr:unnamed protein product [Trifolium pratense]